MRALAVAVLAMMSGCLRDTSFKCSTNAQCGASGVCESVSYCSFPDPDCGRRFGPQSGALAGQCVGGGSGADGGPIDAPRTDAPRDSVILIDAPRCPSDFVPLSGAPTQRRYKMITATDNWVNQKTVCTNAGTNTCNVKLGCRKTDVPDSSLDPLRDRPQKESRDGFASERGLNCERRTLCNGFLEKALTFLPSGTVRFALRNAAI